MTSDRRSVALAAATAICVMIVTPPVAAQIGVPPPMPQVPLPPPIPPPKIEVPPIPKLDAPQPAPKANLGPRQSFGSKVERCRDEAIARGVGPRDRAAYSLACAHRD